MPIDSQLQRAIMGRFATGVTVVTTGRSPDFTGLTANAVASLSLVPPLLLVAVERKAHSHAVLLEHRCYVVNILSIDQEALSRQFARPGPKDFSDLDFTTGETGAPILAGTLAYVECRVVEVLAGGDHDIFVGEIVSGESREGEPLLYYRGAYRRMVDADPR